MRYSIKKSLRVKRREDISRIFEAGCRASNGVATVFVAANTREYSRLGCGVSKKHGHAVRRNSIKRLCREAFRLIRNDLPAGWDIMIVPRRGAEFSLDILIELFKSLVPRAVAQAERRR